MHSEASGFQLSLTPSFKLTCVHVTKCTKETGQPWKRQRGKEREKFCVCAVWGVCVVHDV